MTNQWLKRAGLKSETEGFIIAARDQAIKTNYYSSKIQKMVQIRPNVQNLSPISRNY